MDFFSAVLILVVYFLRPQDWVPGMAGMNLMQPVALFALVALVGRRGVPSYREIIASPLDLLVLIYGAYIILTSSSPSDTFFGFLPFLVFYFVTKFAIDTPARLHRYLMWWVLTLLVLAAFAVGSLFGIDVTGAAELTEKFDGRLAIGTWIHNNPNSLGHTVVLAIPLVYLALFWKFSVGRKIAAVALMALAGYCVYKTESRGSYVAGLAVISFSLTIGRPKFVQVLITVFVITSATAILSNLPRMERFSNLRSDEGVQGRMMAWEIARTSAENQLYGEGWKQFEAYIEYEGEVIQKATHSCYVRIAADLGLPGLFLYLGILWCCIRSLLSLKRMGEGDEDMERCRRILFVLLTGYMVSGWMIDRSYHTEFFLMAGAIAAMYSLFGLRVRAEDEEEQEEGATESGELPSYSVSFGDDMRPKIVAEEVAIQVKQFWRKFGVLDILISFGLLQLTLALWGYILEAI